MNALSYICKATARPVTSIVIAMIWLSTNQRINQIKHVTHQPEKDRDMMQYLPRQARLA
jgi:hypothetical protein